MSKTGERRRGNGSIWLRSVKLHEMVKFNIKIECINGNNINLRATMRKHKGIAKK